MKKILLIIVMLLALPLAFAAWDSPDVVYTFDDAQTQATYAEDVSGNGYDGTFNNATPEATTNATGKSFAGYYGEAYLFYEKAPGTGSADDFNIRVENYQPSGNEFAISFWYYPFYSGQSVIDLSLGGGEYNEMLFWEDDDLVETFFCEDAACSAYIGWYNVNGTEAPYNLTYNAWNHVVTQYNGGDNYTAMEMWINGQKVTPDPGDAYDAGVFSYNINWSAAEIIIGGNKEFNGGAGGYLDEVKIFSEALDQSDVDNLMAAGAYEPPSTPTGAVVGAGERATGILVGLFSILLLIGVVMAVVPLKSMSDYMKKGVIALIGIVTILILLAVLL